MARLINALLTTALGDDCAESIQKISRKTDEENRRDGWAAVFATPELLLCLNQIDQRSLAQTNKEVLTSVRDWTDKCIRWVLATNYSWSEPPRSLDYNSSSAVHGTMKHIKLLSELTERRFFIVGETGATVCFSVDKFLESYDSTAAGNNSKKSPFSVFETSFAGLSRCLPQGMLINGLLHVFGGENPKRSTENRVGLEVLDPLCLLEPKKRWALWGSIHRKPSTWTRSGMSFVSALPEKGLHRFHTTQHNGYVYITGGRYLENTEIRGGASRVNSPKAYRVCLDSLKQATNEGFQRAWHHDESSPGVGDEGGKAALSSEKDDEEGSDTGSLDVEEARKYSVLGLPPLKTGRYGHASVVYKNRLIVAGGEKHSQLESSVEYLDLGEWEQYEQTMRSKSSTEAPTKPEWHSLPPLAAPGRFAFSLLVINGKLYAAGGSDTDSVTIERLDEALGAWEVVARLPGTESDWGAFCVNYSHFIFYFGTYNPHESPHTATPHFNAYDLKSDRWLWSDDSAAGRGSSSGSSGAPQSLLSRLMGQPSPASEYSLPVPFSKFGCFVAAVTEVTCERLYSDHARGSERSRDSSSIKA